MGVPFLTTASSAMCPHGGSVSFAASAANAQVQAGGSPVCLQTDLHTIAGCPFVLPGGKVQPCVTVRWVTAAQMCKVGGIGILTQSSLGLCLSAEQIPQGSVIVTATQAQAGGA